MEVERKLLVDLEERYPDRIFDVESIQNELDRLNKKSGRVLGELGVPDMSSVMISNASHLLDNFTLEGSCIYADVKYLDLPNKKGENAKLVIDSGDAIFSMRSTFVTGADRISIVRDIYTFDVILKEDYYGIGK